MEIKQITTDDAKALSEFYLKNAEHLRVWEPLREEGYHSIDSWRQRLKEREIEQSKGVSAYFISFNPDNHDVVATCSLTNIVKGPFQACNIGYSVSEIYQGKGLMKELCNHAINHAFQEIGLNRIMANYMPNNYRSEKLLNSLGFTAEGIAKNYLLINGAWEDHVLTSLLNPTNT